MRSLVYLQQIHHFKLNIKNKVFKTISKTQIQDLSIDILNLIAENIDKGSDWKQYIFTCKRFYKLNSQDKIDKFSNHLLTVLIQKPNKNWNYSYGLSSSPNITVLCSKICVCARRGSSSPTVGATTVSLHLARSKRSALRVAR